jgi:serine-type D-Ala-D-Ala carboxypeptidase (penicillin-binding protein 5/6)
VKSKKKLLFTFLLIISLFFPTNVNKNKASSSIYIYANAAIACDFDTGAIYYGKEIDKDISLASISKFISVGYFMIKMDEKGITPESTVKISKNVGNFLFDHPEASGIYLPQGEEVTVRSLLELVLVYSDNGATVQLAEMLSGSEDNFVKELNEYLQAINCKKTKFVNCMGLDVEKNGVVEHNISTARDIAKITTDIVSKRPDIIDYTKMLSLDFMGETYETRNKMLPGQPYEYPGNVGLKTGSSDSAGYSFLGLTQQGERQTITLVSGAEDTTGFSSSSSRFTETARLLDYAAECELESLLSADTKIHIPVQNNGLEKDNFIPKREFAILKGKTNDIIFESIQYNDVYFDGDKLIKSVPAGETVARLKVRTTTGNENLSIYFSEGYTEIELTKNSTTRKEGWFQKALYMIPRFFMNLYNDLF